MSLTLEPANSAALSHFCYASLNAISGCDDPLSSPVTERADESLSSLTIEGLSSADSTINDPSVLMSPNHYHGAIPKKLSFRADLNEVQQLLQVRKEKQRLSNVAAIQDWKKTFASKDDHRFFVAMLVVESVRPTNSQQQSCRPPTTRARELLHEIHGAFETQKADPYATLLELVASEKLFKGK